MEEEQVKPKSYKGIAIFLGLLLICSIGYIVYDKVLSNKESSGNVEEKKDGKQEESNQNVEKELTDVAYKEKLDRFMNLVKDYEENSYSFSPFMNDLVNGINELPEKQKREYVLYYLRGSFEKVYDLPAKYKEHSGASYRKLRIDTFKDNYKMFFNENIDIDSLNEIYYKNYDRESFGICPGLWVIDKANNYFYLNDACGRDIGLTKAFIKDYKYTYDNDYYYVYTYIGKVISDSLDGVNIINNYYKISNNSNIGRNIVLDDNLDKFDNIVWKFDKDFRFVGTENINNK